MSSTTLLAPSVSSDALTEVVDGVIVEKVVSAKATLIASWIFAHLDNWLRGRGLGTAVPEMVFVLTDKLKRRPDVAFVSAERWPLDRPIPDFGDWEVIPDLAVEVVSPHDDPEAIAAKINEYFDHGVRQVWLVMPRVRQVQVFESRESSRVVHMPAVLETDLLPGWRLPLVEIFRTTIGG